MNGQVIDAQIVRNTPALATTPAPQDAFKEIQNKAGSVKEILNTVSDILTKVKSMAEMRQQQQDKNTVGDDQRVKTVTEVREVEVTKKPIFDEEKFKQDIEQGLEKLNTLPIPDNIKDISLRSLTDNKDTFNYPLELPLVGKIDINYDFIKSFVVDYVKKNFNKYLRFE